MVGREQHRVSSHGVKRKHFGWMEKKEKETEEEEQAQLN
jgi:hypothetical protein